MMARVRSTALYEAHQITPQVESDPSLLPAEFQQAFLAADLGDWLVMEDDGVAIHGGVIFRMLYEEADG